MAKRFQNLTPRMFAQYCLDYKVPVVDRFHPRLYGHGLIVSIENGYVGIEPLAGGHLFTLTLSDIYTEPKNIEDLLDVMPQPYYEWDWKPLFENGIHKAYIQDRPERKYHFFYPVEGMPCE